MLPAGNQPAKPLQPSEETLYRPAQPVAAKRSPVLRRMSAVAAVRSDHLNPVFFFHLPVQGIAVVGLIPDQSRRKLVEKAVPEGLFDELAFVRRSTLDTDGERKTVASGDGRELRPFVSLGRANPPTPFFRGRKGRVDESFF